MAKICRATQTEPLTRYEKIVEFCHEHEFLKKMKFYQKLLDVLID
jgi:hypothetical protein